MTSLYVKAPLDQCSNSWDHREEQSVAIAVCVALWAMTGSPMVDRNPVFIGSSSTVIKGINPVTYFREGRPMNGQPEFAFEWNDATWHFPGQANFKVFRADTVAFAPQYGGYCAWAVSNEYTAPSVPEAWTIHDGRLYLNYSLSIQTH